jgi:hypothetical protein
VTGELVVTAPLFTPPDGTQAPAFATPPYLAEAIEVPTHLMFWSAFAQVPIVTVSGPVPPDWQPAHG